MKKHIKLTAAVIAFIFCIISFTGCNGNTGTSDTATDTSSTSGTTALATTATTETPTTTEPTTPAPTEPPPTFTPVVILDCTKSDYNKLGKKMAVQSENPAPPTGETAYWFSPASLGDVVMQATIPAFDATQNNYMTGALKVNIWVSDINLMGGESQFEFNPTQPDVIENGWNWKNQVVQDGWNTVYLPWDQARADGDPDNSSLTWFRMYDVGRTCDYAIGSISIVPISEVPSDVIDFSEAAL